jgi:hypothetical protein
VRRQTRIPKRTEPRPCFVVVSFEGCYHPGLCQSPHIIVDCEVHGMLARVENEDTGRFIMKGHMANPTWPVPVEPLTAACLNRIVASKVSKNVLHVPSDYGGRR